MNLVHTLQKGHSKSITDRIVRYVGRDARRFAELVRVFRDGPYRITQRAAWPLSYCVEQHPELIRPHLKTLIRYLRTPHPDVAVKRNTVRLLQFIDIPRSLQGEVATLCFDLFQNPIEPVAIKVFSMSVLAKLAIIQPGLKNELRLLIDKQLPYSSPAFRSRAGKVMKQLT